MPVNVTITAEELKELLAERDAARALREEQEALRGALRLVTAERDLAEERLRAYRHELFGAKSEARDTPGATAIAPSRSMCASWFIFFSQFDDSSVNIWPVAGCIGISRRSRILVWIGRIFRSGWRRMAHGIAQLVAFPCLALTLRRPTL